MKRLKHIEKNKVHSHPFIYHPELIIKEMQIKMRYHFTSIKLAKTCTSDNPQVWAGMLGKKYSDTADKVHVEIPF